MTTRRCPRCTFSLVPHMHGETEVDSCPRCRGTWLDAGDAKKMLGENAEPATWERTTVATFKGKGELACPLGHGALSMFTLQAPPASGVDVEVDVCSECMGMWLDAWEAARITQATKDAQLVKAEGAVPLTEHRTGAGWYLFMLFSGMPVEEYNPVRKQRVVVLALMIACALVFVIELTSVDTAAFLETWGLVPADFVQRKNMFSIVTHMFLHGGYAHIAANMWFLYTFGDNIEDRVGRVNFLVLYLAFGVTAALAQTAMSLGSVAPLVGASGAIAGLMGAYVMLFPKARLYQVLLFVRFKIPVWAYLALWALLQAVLAYLSVTRGIGPGVAWWAHLGGFVAGAVWGALNRKRYGDGAELRVPVV